MGNAIVDYSKKSRTTAFIHEGVKYAVSFIEDYHGFEEEAAPTGKYLVIATWLRGTHMCYFHRDIKNGDDWMPDDKNFLHLIPIDYFHFIQDQLAVLAALP